MNDNQQTVTVTLTLDQLNVIMAQLVKLPFEMIAPLVQNIQNQVNTQLANQTSEFGE